VRVALLGLRGYFIIWATQLDFICLYPLLVYLACWHYALFVLFPADCWTEATRCSTHRFRSCNVC
jgi:hypothetical protein